MKSTIARLLALALLCVATSSSAVIPEAGLWWNPAEGGRGYGIEMQDDSVFVTYYGYQPDGTRSAFYTTFGKLNSDTGTMTGYWAAAESGQCFGCPHRQPQLTDLGTATLRFTSPMTGEITLPGNIRIPIRRQLLVGASHHDPVAMLGIWTITSGAIGIYFGDLLWFNRVEPGAQNRYSGHRVDANSRILLGGPTGAATGLPMIMLVDSSTSYYTAYAYDNALNFMGGRSWTYLKSSEPSGAGLIFFGKRLMGHMHALQSASAQAAPAKAMDTSAADEQDRQRYVAGLAVEPASEVTIEAKSYRLDDIHAAIAALQAEIQLR